MGIFCAFLCAVLVHEGGHIAAAYFCGVPVRCLRLGAVGFRLCIDYSGVSYGRELAILLAGSAAGLLGAWMAYLCGWSDAVLYHLALSGCNLLPVQGLDGGAALEVLLNMRFLPDTACRIARAFSFVIVVALWIAVVWICMRVQVNLGLLLTALWFLWGHLRR